MSARFRQFLDGRAWTDAEVPGTLSSRQQHPCRPQPAHHDVIARLAARWRRRLGIPSGTRSQRKDHDQIDVIEIGLDCTTQSEERLARRQTFPARREPGKPERGVMAADLEDLARKGIENFNVSDWQAARELCAPGYVYEETGTGRRITDLDELVAALQAWKAALPDATGEVLRVVSAGDTTVMEVRWTGTQSGPMDLGGTVLPPSGQPVSTLATIWQRWQDGLTIEERHHLDMLSMLGQVGALPPPATS